MFQRLKRLLADHLEAPLARMYERIDEHQDELESPDPRQSDEAELRAYAALAA